MNLYLDTSALVKLYVREPGSDTVRRRVSDASVVATSRVAYPEARAAFARRRREGGFGAADLRRIVADLDRDFAALVVVELSGEVARLAGELAEARALSGFDAIHVASALTFGRLAGTPPVFATYDSTQAAAAAAEGLPA